MLNSKSIRTVLIVVGSFLLYYSLFLNFKSIKTSLDKITHQGLLSYIITYMLIGLPIFAGTYFINYRRSSLVKSLGLAHGMMKAVAISLLFTAPMFLGGFFFFKFNNQIDVQQLIAGTLIAGFAEELYFRGFLFGQIFRNTTIGFIPAIAIGAVLFAIGHLYQSSHVLNAIGIFSITFMGAVFFAWLFLEWHYNLWIPIFVHTFMNLSWQMYSSANTALGGWEANIFRAITIAFAIVFTIRYKRKQGIPLTIKPAVFWRKRY